MEYRARKHGGMNVPENPFFFLIDFRYATSRHLFLILLSSVFPVSKAGFYETRGTVSRTNKFLFAKTVRLQMSVSTISDAIDASNAAAATADAARNARVDSEKSMLDADDVENLLSGIMKDPPVSDAATIDWLFASATPGGRGLVTPGLSGSLSGCRAPVLH